jgi:hypothetical protein
MAEIHVGDIGTAFIVTVKDEDEAIVDVSTATTKQIIFKKSDGSVVTKTASFVTDGTDGQIKYVSVADDLDVAGLWYLQAFIDFGSTEWKSDIRKFKVYPNLEEC